METTEYQAFLEAKIAVAPSTGIMIDPADISPILKPHQKDMVHWAVEGGRRALFASFGLGKTLMQLEICRLLLQEKGGSALIVCPLGVRQEFLRDAGMLGTPITFVRKTAEVEDPGLYLTNYESVREGKLDPRGFTVVSLDEAAILRSGGNSKTFRTLMGLFEGTSMYRFVATALPAPNEYPEMLVYADWLGIMDQSQSKTRFFKRDSTKADHLTLHKSREADWYAWLASWACFVQSPADLCACGCHAEER